MIEWHLLRLNPMAQTRFLDHATTFFPHIPLYFPRYKRLTRPHGHRRPFTTEVPVFPGYVFANLSLTSHDSYIITHSPIRARFVRFGHTIPSIKDSIIHEIRRLESLNQLVREIRVTNPYYRGRKVIVHIPVADIPAIILRIIAQTKVQLDTPLGTMIVPIHTIDLNTR